VCDVIVNTNIFFGMGEVRLVDEKRKDVRRNESVFESV
jgi:hypothetical protein